jgi:integrase
MARTVSNKDLYTRTARLGLKSGDRENGKKIWWVSLSPGCALGYRKGPKGGVWLAKLVRGDFRRETTLGPADDVFDPDGVLAIDYTDAQARARKWFREITQPTSPASAYTVDNASADYLTWFRDNGRKSIKETETTINAFILPRLGDQVVMQLTPARLRRWHGEIAAAAPRLRTRNGRAQRIRDTADDPEAPRRRRASANRILTVLKALLNHAWREALGDKGQRLVSSDEGWRSVTPFPEADVARVRYLDRDECRRLVNASPEPLRSLVRAALFTGARYGELTRMQVADFHRDSGTLLVRTSKAGEVRHIELTAEGLEFFRGATIGRVGDELLFHRDGVAWGKSHQQRPLSEACRAAKVLPAASFYTLRHTYASLMVMDDVPRMVVAKNLGHADTRMVDKHYGHLATNYIREAIRSAKPLGIGEAVKVVPLAGER